MNESESLVLPLHHSPILSTEHNVPDRRVVLYHTETRLSIGFRFFYIIRSEFEKTAALQINTVKIKDLPLLIIRFCGKIYL